MDEHFPQRIEVSLENLIDEVKIVDCVVVD